MLCIREMQPELHPGHVIFTRRDVEPELLDQEILVRSGFWPGQAMIRSSVVVQSESLIALHITAYPRHGFTELWRYYFLEEGTWQQRSWQQLPILTRLQIAEAYQQAAPAFAVHPGNVPGHPGISRARKQGLTYLLVVQEERLLSLVNYRVAYTLGKSLPVLRHTSYSSYPDKTLLLLKWHQGLITTWKTEPFEAAVVECTVGGKVQWSQGRIESESLCPIRLVEQFIAVLPASAR